METFMDWRLEFRTAEEIMRLGAKLGANAKVDYFDDPYGAIGYVVVDKL